MTSGIKASAILAEGASAKVGCTASMVTIEKQRSGCDFVDSAPTSAIHSWVLLDAMAEWRNESEVRWNKVMNQFDLFGSDLVAAQFLGRATTSAYGEASYDRNTYCFNEEPVFDKGPIFYEEPVIDLELSSFNNVAPFNCSTYCLSQVIDVMTLKIASFDEGPLFDRYVIDERPMLDGELDCSSEPDEDRIPLKAARAMHPGAGLEENVQGLEVRLDELAALLQLNSDEHVQLQGLLKVAIDDPCYDSTQPLTLRLSSYAKWSAWQKLGSMHPEIALEKYINLLSQVIPRWLGSEIMDTKKYETGCYSVGFISRAATSDQQNHWESEDINSKRKDGRNMLLLWSTENVDRALEPYLMSNHNP
jgi:acyl-CoA-binding protein